MVHTDTYSKPTVNGEVSSPLNPNDIDIDCDSLFSETSTLRSFHLKNFDSPSNDSKGKEPEYGKGTEYGKGISPVLSPTTPTPYFDPSYLNDKILPTAPGGDEEHDSRTHFRRRTPSPGRRKVLKSHRRLPSRTRAEASRSPEPTPLEALSGALGPDNVAHTSELDSIPCAGIRIPSGPFTGLLAWRLVVRVHPGRERFFGRHGYKKELALLPHTDIRLAGNMPPPPKKKASYDDVQQGGGHHGRTMSELGSLFPVSQPISRGLGARFPSGSTTSLPAVGKKQSRRSTDPAMEDSEGWSVLPSPHRPFQGTWGSSQSLPMAVGKSSSHKDRRSSWVSGSNIHDHHSAASAPAPAPSSTKRGRNLEAVVTNFLFDTSQAHNTISRETLQTLGFSDRIIDGLEASSESAEPKTISLYVQNGGMPITFLLASPGEPSRLGVQFLTESEVNVCMGEGGRGAVIWIDKTAEKKMRLHDVPRTVPLPKLSLQARVRALFGLSS